MRRRQQVVPDLLDRDDCGVSIWNLQTSIPDR
jgi:hypothetical protein